MKDLIDEKNRQEKMKRSIIKYWNVSYGSPEAIDEVSQTKIQQILHEKDDRLQNLIEHEQHEGQES